VNKDKSDHERSGPAVNRPDDPAKRNLGHYSAHTLVGLFQGGTVVKNKDKPCDNLNGEKKQDSTSCVIPDGMLVLRDFFLS
jgi:hypothetical protein